MTCSSPAQTVRPGATSPTRPSGASTADGFRRMGKKMLYRRRAARPPRTRGHQPRPLGREGHAGHRQGRRLQPAAPGQRRRMALGVVEPRRQAVRLPLQARRQDPHRRTRHRETVVKEMPRQGIFQQMFWSPDGKRLCGTANLNGQDWNILSLELETGKPRCSRAAELHARLVPGRPQPRHLLQSHAGPGRRLRLDHADAGHGRRQEPHPDLRRTRPAHLLRLHLARRPLRDLLRPESDGGTDAPWRSFGWPTRR